MVLALVKQSDDLISFCECQSAFATQGQMDCPWCGCGWLFTCAQCRRAFTFAVLREVPESYEDLARIETEGFHGRPSSSDDTDRMKAEAEWQAFWGQHASRNETLVYLDGQVIPASLADFEFEGWTARHSFKNLPHGAGTREALEEVFGNPAYWKDRALEKET